MKNLAIYLAAGATRKSRGLIRGFFDCNLEWLRSSG